MNCWICDEPLTEGQKHTCPSGSYGSIKVSRHLFDIWKMRMESVGLALGEMSPGDEPGPGLYVSWFEKSLTLLDVPCTTIRRWFDSGERRVTGPATDKTAR